MPDISDAQIDSVQFNDLSSDASTPSSGRIRLFFKSGVPYFRNAAGLISSLIGAAGSTLDYIHLADEKSSGTAGGTFTSGSWVKRTLNVEKSDAGGHCTLSNSQFTLEAGTYRFSASAPAIACNEHKLRLQNVTDGTTILIGKSSYTAGVYPINALLTGRFTISSSKTFELQHKCASTRNTDGLGLATSLDTEVYAEVVLEKE